MELKERMNEGMNEPTNNYMHKLYMHVRDLPQHLSCCSDHRVDNCQVCVYTIIGKTVPAIEYTHKIAQT